jgi:hypothetical protein
VEVVRAQRPQLDDVPEMLINAPAANFEVRLLPLSGSCARAKPTHTYLTSSAWSCSACEVCIEARWLKRVHGVRAFSARHTHALGTRLPASFARWPRGA